MGDYDHLHSVQTGDKTTAIVIDMAGYTPGKGGSGHTDPGFYELTVISAEWRKKKSGSKEKGVSMDIVYRISKPAKYAGIQVRMFHPQPQEDKPDDRGWRMYRNILGSVMSATDGKLEQLEGMQAGSGKMNISPATFVGKKLWARLDDDAPQEGSRYGVSSRVSFYITKQDYSANPGPDVVTAAVAIQGGEVNTAAMSGSLGDLATPANGAGQKAKEEKSSVDSMLEL